MFKALSTLQTLVFMAKMEASRHPLFNSLTRVYDRQLFALIYYFFSSIFFSTSPCQNIKVSFYLFFYIQFGHSFDCYLFCNFILNLILILLTIIYLFLSFFLLISFLQFFFINWFYLILYRIWSLFF
jgi:hypothetical protein